MASQNNLTINYTVMQDDVVIHYNETASPSVLHKNNTVTLKAMTKQDHKESHKVLKLNETQAYYNTVTKFSMVHILPKTR
jgi:hypothetical protein